MNELFHTYQTIVLADEQLPPPVSEEELLLTACFKRVVVMALLFFPLNCYYLLADHFSGLHSQPLGYLNLDACLVAMAASLWILLLSRISSLRRNLLVIRLSLLGYYISMLVIVFLFAVPFHYRAHLHSMPSDYVGLPLSLLYLLVFLVAPLPNRKDSVLLMCGMFISMALQFVMPGYQTLSLFRELSFRVILAIGYYYLWQSSCHLAAQNAQMLLLNQQLLQFSYIDNLTGTLNRNALDRYIAYLSTQSHQPSISVIMLDVDFFKLYNDRYSHNAGDNVLAAITAAICSTLGEKDPFLFRYGGEEFLILAHDQTDESLVALAQKYRQAVAKLNIFRADGAPLDHVTISLGCAHLNIEDSFSRDFIIPADTQLYHAKENGRDCVAFRNEIFR